VRRCVECARSTMAIMTRSACRTSTPPSEILHRIKRKTASGLLMEGLGA